MLLDFHGSMRVRGAAQLARRLCREFSIKSHFAMDWPGFSGMVGIPSVIGAFFDGSAPSPDNFRNAGRSFPIYKPGQTSQMRRGRVG
jgi:hypothetical protein